MNAPRPTDGLERRAATELRATGRRLIGYAATFGTEARIGRFTESITRGAFAASLPGRDILALVDHDPTRLLARTKAGTLRLAEDTRGLHFEIDLPETTLGRDILAHAERSDLGGMSFGFRVKAEDWPSKERRVLRAVELLEISVVQAFPAYATTTVEARSQASLTARARRLFMETL